MTITVIANGINLASGASSAFAALPTDSAGTVPRAVRVATTAAAHVRVGQLDEPLATPVNAAFSTATTGGTLAAGTYWYRVSATNAAGETLASAETSITTTGTTSTATVNWGAVTGATGYKIYGRATGAEQFLASVGAVTTWTDTGSAAPAGALPASNTTAILNASITNMMVLPNEAVMLAIPRGVTHVAVIQDSAAGNVNVAPMESC